MRAVLQLLLTSVAFAVPLRAQPVNAPRVGQTVRLWAAQPPLTKQVGSVVAPHGDTLRVRRRLATPLHPPSPPIWDTLHVAWGSVHRLEVREISHAWGALKGFFWGFGVGYLFGVLLEQGRQADWAPIPTQTVLGVTGMAVGTVLGAVIGSESWRRVYP